MREAHRRFNLWPIVWALLLTGCQGIITPESGMEAPVLSPVNTSPARPATMIAPTQAPPATATPTVAPTPIVHVIQSGETLSVIAAEYGVTVEGLMTTNGVENPLLIQPGQELVIPTDQELEEIEPTLLLPTLTPVAFAVRGIGFYETPMGSLDCLGEVVNVTPELLTHLQVRVTLFDAGGTPLIEGTAFSAADVLPPSSRAPFRILFTSPPPDFASHQVTIVRGEPAGELAAGNIPFATEQVSGRFVAPQFQVSGVVRNTDPAQMAFNVVVIVTTYGKEGRVTGFRQQTVTGEDGVAPGAEIPFQILLSTYGGTPTDYSVIAFGQSSTEEE